MCFKSEWIKSSALVLSLIYILVSTTAASHAEEWVLLGTASCSQCEGEKEMEFRLNGPPIKSKSECLVKRAKFEKELKGTNVSVDLYCEKTE